MTSVISMLETKCVDDNFKMLITFLAIFVSNIQLLTLPFLMSLRLVFSHAFRTELIEIETVLASNMMRESLSRNWMWVFNSLSTMFQLHVEFFERSYISRDVWPWSKWSFLNKMYFFTLLEFIWDNSQYCRLLRIHFHLFSLNEEFKLI